MISPYCLQIAIDGPAASGKSTLGRSIARELECPFLDTGQMYRAVTRTALERRVALDDAAELTRIAASTVFRVEPNGLMIDEQEAGGELHTPEVDAAVSQVSAHADVRAALVQRQREIAGGERVVMVGRDIGTVVLPDARVKLWLTASHDERARRRQRDRAPSSAAVDVAGTTAQLEIRDQFDRTRAHSPLRKAADAILIDTDGRTASQVFEEALSVIRSACPGHRPR